MINIIVETYDGSQASKKECRFIKGEFYIKNKQCFLIDGVWYRVNSGFIVFDHEKQSWVVAKNNPSLVKGIVSFDAETGDAILGFYTPNPYNNVSIITINGGQYQCVNYRILPSTFVEDTERMMFIHKDCTSTRISTRPNSVQYNNNAYPYPLPYCTKHYTPEISKLFKDAVEKGNQRISTNIGNYASEIGDYSFGFEFETNRGKIPNYKILETGLLPLRDGSISGIEFATIPLRGRKGIATLEEACKSLKKYTTISEQESLHLHIGNIPTGKSFIGSLFTISCILEKEIYSLFPAWYATTSKFKARGKDYNMPLRKDLVGMTPEETFANLAFHLSDGKKYQGFGSNHPSDPEGTAKWGIQSRYVWENMIPLLFGDNNTIEFRVHVPSHDSVKVINWLYICSAIIKYTEKIEKGKIDLNTQRSLTLSKVFESVYSYKLANYLNGYIAQRKANRIIDEGNGDFTGKTEINAELKGKSLYADLI